MRILSWSGGCRSHGKGIYYHKDGATYDGEWNNDLYHGFGNDNNISKNNTSTNNNNNDNQIKNTNPIENEL